MVKSKIGPLNFILILFYIYLYSLVIFLTFILPNISPNHPVTSSIAIFWAIIILFPPTPFLLFFYYNSFLKIDVNNKVIKFKKIFTGYKTYELQGDESYITRRIGGKFDYTFVYLYRNDSVVFAYQNVFNSNWSELEEVLNNMGINEASYDGMVLFRDLFKMRL
jgi:hypothetical protein